MPFTLQDTDFKPLLENIRQKIILRDIPSVVALKVEELSLLEKMLSFIGKASVEDINYSSLSRNIGITKYKAEAYCTFFEQAFILNVVLLAGTNVLKEPKILMHLPWRLLYSDFHNPKTIGALREDFFMEAMRMRGVSVNYLKSTSDEKTPDYLVTFGTKIYIIEIGGRSKGREQFKGISQKEKFVFTHPSIEHQNKKPLLLVGLLR